MNRRAVLRACRPYLVRNHLFLHEAGAPLPPAPAIAAGYAVIFPADARDLTDGALRGSQITRNVIDQRLGHGDQLGVVLWDGHVVHRSFVQTTGHAPMEGDRRAFVLAHGDRYVHSCFTVAQHRGRGLYGAMLRCILTHHAAAGDTYIACRQSNQASIHAILRAGFAYLESETVAGWADGRLRIRRWYTAPSMSSDAPRA